MSRASRLTMIPLAALSASLLVPQVTMAASHVQQHHQQHQQCTCSDFSFVLPTSETGLGGPALVSINSDNSANPVSVEVFSNGTLTPVSGATYSGGVLTVPGASNTFTLSAPLFLGGFIQ